MSRIGNKPVPIIDGVKVDITNGTINIEGPKGKLSYTHRPEIDVVVEGSEVKVSRRENDKFSRSFHGLTRSLVSNMILGVKEGYECGDGTRIHCGALASFGVKHRKPYPVVKHSLSNQNDW